MSFLIILFSKNGFVQFIAKPFWITNINIQNKINENEYVFYKKSTVFQKSIELNEENTNLKNKMLDYEILENENLELKELLGRISPENKFVLASILTKPNFSPYDTITIDVGVNDGIKIGDKVFASAVTPIGEIDTVFQNTSLVVLYSNPGKVTLGMIEGLNTNIEITGRGGGNFEMTTPVDLYVEKGKNILIPGTSTEIIAVVGDIISMENDPIKKFILESPININDLKWVEVKVN